MVEIREEQAADAPAIRSVNEEALGQTQEASIVDKLHQSSGGLLSLVAVIEGRLVGHILFSPVAIEGCDGMVQGMGLGPMAVLPEYQRQGIGSRLIEEGLRILRSLSCPFVVVLGHPDYYPRFGFQRASRFGITSQWEHIPDSAFMICILDDRKMQGVSGVARYRDEFNEA
jgi:putative acetyltransferase